MHELQVATQIIEIVQQEMESRKLAAVSAIGVRVGALSGFNPDALEFSFEAAVADTPLSETRLEIEYIPIRGECRECRHNFESDEMIIACPACGSGQLDISRGDDLEISYIEGG